MKIQERIFLTLKSWFADVWERDVSGEGRREELLYYRRKERANEGVYCEGERLRERLAHRSRSGVSQQN